MQSGEPQLDRACTMSGSDRPGLMPAVLLASPRGFCAGVRRAIRIVELALDERSQPVFVRHEIVHNRSVLDRLERVGATFVEDLSDVPAGATLIFSAHGVSVAVRKEARRRGFDTIDATCPLVAKVHRDVAAHIAVGRHVLLIGHRGHPEVEGTLGQVRPGAITLVEGPRDVAGLPRFDQPLAYAMQTTLSVDEAATTVEALRRRWPAIIAPDRADICYATTNRQAAVKRLTQQCQAVLVVGSSNSSNSRRLQETATSGGVPAQLVEDEGAVDWAPLSNLRRVGITAGASAPDWIVRQVAAAVAERLDGCPIVELDGPAEPDIFALPKRFRNAMSPRQAHGRTTSC